MRFEHGMWFWEDDVTPVLPKQVAEIVVTPVSLTAYAAAQQYTDRSGTLNTLC